MTLPTQDGDAMSHAYIEQRNDVYMVAGTRVSLDSSVVVADAETATAVASISIGRAPTGRFLSFEKPRQELLKCRHTFIS
jgi:hypothetical protein